MATSGWISSPRYLPRPARAWLRVVNLTLGIAFLAVVIWVTTQSALTAFRYGRVSAVLLYPLWMPMLLIPAGLLLMALCMVATLRRQLKAALGPRAGRDEVPPSPGCGERSRARRCSSSRLMFLLFAMGSRSRISMGIVGVLGLL